MNEISPLSIKSATVEIKVLKVDGHKMTKAVFRQINEKTIFQVNHLYVDLDFGELLFPPGLMEQVLGYVMDVYCYILWHRDGLLFKQKISQRMESDLFYSVKEKITQLFIAT